MKIPWLTICSSLLLAPVVAPVSARAQQSDTRADIAPPPIEALTSKARELYVEGSELYNKGQYDRALASFQAAWALKKHWQIAGMLGLCELKLGRFVAAATHLSFSLENASSSVSAAERERLRGSLYNAEQQVGTLHVSAGNLSGDLLVDGNMVGSVPLLTKIYVRPGPHKLTLRAKDGTRELDVDVPAGEKKNISFEHLAPRGGSNGSHTSDSSGAATDGSHSDSPVGAAQDLGSTRAKAPDTWTEARTFVVVGGAAVALVGATVGLTGAQDKHAMEELGTATQAELDGAAARRDVGLVVGGVGLATGLAAWLLWPQPKADWEPSSRSFSEVLWGRGKATTTKKLVVGSTAVIGLASLGASAYFAMDASSKADDENGFVNEYGGWEHVCRDSTKEVCRTARSLHDSQRDAVLHTALAASFGLMFLASSLVFDAALPNDRSPSFNVGYLPRGRGGGLWTVGGVF